MSPAELLLNGEYRIILRLVGVLSQGKLAKLLVDEAVDRMDQVQNLRVACYDARLRAENAPVGSAKRRHLSTVFNNYLARWVAPGEQAVGSMLCTDLALHRILYAGTRT